MDPKDGLRPALASGLWDPKDGLRPALTSGLWDPKDGLRPALTWQPTALARGANVGTATTVVQGCCVQRRAGQCMTH